MLYKTNADSTARFALGELGAKNLVVFGVNPSTATDTQFDRTIHRVESYSHAHGFDGWLMLNLYPQRATNPLNLHIERNDVLHGENLEIITQYLQDMPNSTLCAAWGGIIERREYLLHCLTDIVSALAQHPWHRIGEPTKSGHPRHPLYVREATALQPFDVQSYQRIPILFPHVT